MNERIYKGFEIIQTFAIMTSIAEQKFVAGYGVHPQYFKQLGNSLNKPVTYFCPTVLERASLVTVRCGASGTMYLPTISTRRLKG